MQHWMRAAMAASISLIFLSGTAAVAQSDPPARVGRIIHATFPPVARQFAADRSFAILGAADEVGRVWASLLRGRAGFLAVFSHKAKSRASALPAASQATPIALRKRNQASSS